MTLALKTLAFFVRRFPVESGRWRVIPYALQSCEECFQTTSFRTIRTRHGFRMRVDPSEWLGRHIYVMGEYEPATTAVFRSCLTKGQTVIDVGANAGYFSLLARKLVGAEGVVLSYEPLPIVREALSLNFELNGWTTNGIRGVALSAENGEAEFHAGPVNHRGVSSLRKLEESSETIRVATARMDDVIPPDRPIDLVKIDVEGAECHVLEGMQRILKEQSPDLVIEVSPSYLEGLGRSVCEMDRLLKSYGYRTFAICHEGLRPLDSLGTSATSQYNAFLTTRSVTPRGIRLLG